MHPSSTPDSQALYHSQGLRRSHPSSSSLHLGHEALSTSAKSPSVIQPAEHQEHALSAASPTHSSTSNFSFQPSPPTLSLEPQASNDDDDISFPDYGGVRFNERHEGSEESHSSDEPVGSTTDTTASDSPLPTPTVADDTAIKQEPKQHVDYLSHNWREEDIWSSWRHIVSQRRVYGQRSRLENASWRTWAKSKYKLRTVSPETLNWLKESDVTWLYGPLKPATSHPITAHLSEPMSQISKSNSFVHKKPILKKRSMSEVMLQKSLSASSLVKQAAAAVQAQQGKHSRKASFHRTQSDFSTSTAPSETPSRDQLDYFTSRSSSSNCTPCECHEKRHIRFDDKVEQCIAVECKEDLEDDLESEIEDGPRPGSPESGSDDGVIMMRRKAKPGNRNNSKTSRSSSVSRKTIETLPATTLKYRTDSPDVSEAQQHHVFGRAWGSSRLSPSPSQETLRPSHPSANFLLPEEKEAEAENSSSWSFGASNPRSSLGASASTPAPEPSESNLRRTGSGMLMPYDDEEEEVMAVGLFGRVSETINTARDIAHVIWNVGWRK
ncbi:hypothetical protein BAUCODRAFT_113998 [Baudoinia panamericana UAMH 10762]|uniref:Nitrogen regulatory protein areA GATA-like domain-containing protein n=1 Tax=Baudoinia panamericana (strain UAMH 10762) TaxID=717646 RepID=M2N3I0_BAUPA|nr:uncharacterized protein BAUCODRAFT_113998 [Baudoinia panamericana UAMH 10762]EMC93549.1 hypothetical protein BAUCODRAFT_113998 [Baudoinia panamericana UAMH 10762]